MRTTPLHDWHVAHRGRMVDFAGWSMPVQYGSIVEEHLAVRSKAGLFDVSHMGRLRFDGPRAALFLDSLLTRRVSRLKPGQVRYSLVTNHEGGIRDDVLVGRHPATADSYQLVVNASNREKLLDWIRPRVASFGGVSLIDQTCDSAMLAVQGPLAVHILAPLLQPLPTTLDSSSASFAPAIAAMPYYSALAAHLAIDGLPAVAGPLAVAGAAVEVLVSRTGYTGEDGYELIIPAAWATVVADWLVAAGACPVGLGARDTLRLEAAMPLYGHELSESIDPYSAGLGFAVELDGRDFPGSAVLERLAQQPPPRVRIGLIMDGQRVPREGFAVLQDGVVAGVVSSGTFSPTLRKPIAMAYVESRFAGPGGSFAVDIRGQHEPAVMTPLPFYRRPARGARLETVSK
jgi:aminomethyltransferase